MMVTEHQIADEGSETDGNDSGRTEPGRLAPRQQRSPGVGALGDLRRDFVLMATPTMVTVTGRLMMDESMPDVGGVVRFRRSLALTHSDGTVYEPIVERGIAGADGLFQLELAASNDPAWSPLNVPYAVTVQPGNGGVPWSFSVVLPYNDTAVTFGELSPITDLVAPQLYALVNHTHEDSGAVEWAEIDGKPSTFPPTLPIAPGDVTGLTTALSDRPTSSAVGSAITAAGAPKANTTDVANALALKADTTALSGYATTGALSSGLDAKAPLASPAFTGTPTGIIKTHVGLGSVDNTADTAKPVSTAQATAIGLKANLASPTFTGTPAAPTAASQTASTQIGTTGHTWAALAQALNLLTTGEEVIPRDSVSEDTALDSGTIFLSYFTARKTETINSILTGTGGQPFVGTLARIGVWSVSGGVLTLVASTANDITLWSSSYTTYTKNLSTPWAKVAGTRYALGYLCVGTQMPQLECCPVRYHSSRRAPAVQGEFPSQTDLVSSINETGLGNGYRRYQGIFLP